MESLRYKVGDKPFYVMVEDDDDIHYPCEILFIRNSDKFPYAIVYTKDGYICNDIASESELIDPTLQIPVFDKTCTPEEYACTKESNPKDSCGVKKSPMSTVSAPVMAELGVAMLEGARKYGRHNYRVVSVKASVYYDAAMRHLMQWFEGEDIDPDSGISHVTKAIASLVVLRDGMIQKKFIDDRPPSSPDGWMRYYNEMAESIIRKYPDCAPCYTKEGKSE